VSDLRGLGFGSFCSGPKWDWGLGPRSDPSAMGVRQGGDPKGLGDGSVSEPKGIRSVSAPYGVGVGVWVLLWSDPRGLWFGSFRVRTQGGWVRVRPKRVFVPGVFVYSYSTPCLHQMCNPQLNDT